MTELVLKDIKTAIKNRIAVKYPDAKYYIDGDIKSYPAFYIRTTNIEREKASLRREQVFRDTFYIRVEYREAEEPTSATNLNSKLDEVGMALQDALRYIEVYGQKFYVEMTNNETVDNVRIFDFYVIFNTTFEKEPEPIMETMENTEKLKEE